MNSPHRFRRCLAWPDRWPGSLVLLAVAGVAVLWRLAWAWQGVDLFSDDAYYYAIIARNFVETGRFTFDGSSLTNGFHPLLFWLEAAGFLAFGTGASPSAQYLGIFAGVGTVFLLTVGGCLLAVCRRPSSEADAVVQSGLLITVCVVLVPRFTMPFLGGMEAILVLPLLVLFGVLTWKERYLAAGICGLLLVMARLDTLPYVVLPIGLVCVRRRWEQRRLAIRGGLQVVLPAAIGTAALMLWHTRHFGHPVPIHGVLKSCFPKVHFQWQHVLGGPLGSPTVTMALLAAVVAVGLLLRGGRIDRQARQAGLTAAALGLLQLAAFVLFQKWSKPVPVWYLGPAILAATFAMAVGVANTVGLRRMRIVSAAAVIGVLAVNVVSTARVWRRRAPPPAIAKAPLGEADGQPENIVQFMKGRPGRVWASTDCGKLAFWSGQRVVNLDGLVNGFDYQDDLRHGRLVRHLLQKNVKYLICTAWDRPQTDWGEYEPMYACRVAPDLFSGSYERAEFYVYSYKYMKYSDRIRLPRYAEVWRSAPQRDGRAMARTVVFDLPRALRGRSVPADAAPVDGMVASTRSPRTRSARLP